MKTAPKQLAPLYASNETEIAQLIHKGSSGAQLWIIDTPDGRILRKYTKYNPIKLLEQYQWLTNFSDNNFFPEVSNPTEGLETFSYDMNFFEGATDLSTLISSSQKISSSIISNLFNDLFEHFYVTTDDHFGYSHYEYYLREKFFKKVKACELSSPELKSLFSTPKIKVNGVEYFNFPEIWKKLLEDSTRKLIRTFNSNALDTIHGDMTAENILLDGQKLILIDPNQENHISTFGAEVGKVFQSLNSYYEQLAFSTVSFQGTEIVYNVVMSDEARITSQKIIKNILSVHRLSPKEVHFHEAIHFSRMLPYKLFRDKNFLIYYARMIELFNKVLW